MDYQEKVDFMCKALQVIINYTDLHPEIDTPGLRSQITAIIKGEPESLSLTLDNSHSGVGDISFGYTIRSGSLRLTFNQASTGTNLWVAEPYFLFEKLRIRAKQEELIISWFQLILVEWAKLHDC
jgi:hypothetical protein